MRLPNGWAVRRLGDNVVFAHGALITVPAGRPARDIAKLIVDGHLTYQSESVRNKILIARLEHCRAELRALRGS